MLRPVWDVSADQQDMGQKPREDSPTDLLLCHKRNG